jgi:hypothetical protein
MIVKLTGISGHGRNRIREQGQVWVQHHTTSPLRSDSVLLKSIKTGDLRWVRWHNDDHFDIEVVKND